MLTWQIMLTIILLLDGLWNARLETPVTNVAPDGTTIDFPLQWYPDKPTMISFAKEIEVYRDQFNWQAQVPEKMLMLFLLKGCLGHDGNTIWDCVVAREGNVWRGTVGGYSLNWGMIQGVSHGLWSGATQGTFNMIGCKRAMLINMKLRYPTNTWFGTPFWLGVVAHELYHADQGGMCEGNLNQVETAAQMGAYETMYKLWQDGGPWADTGHAGLIYMLRRDAIHTAIFLADKEGVDWKTEILDKLKLSEKEKQYFYNVNLAGIYRSVQVYHLWFWQQLLEDEDHIIENSATLNPIDFTGIYQMLARAFIQEEIK